MDINERTQRAIEVGMARLTEQDRDRITDLNAQFDRLLKQGLVVEDKFGLAMNGMVRSQNPITVKR